ncbi:hypothetical protein D3C79_843140 [compost metagenome]
MAQVATGDPVGGVEGLAQGDDDLAGDGPGGKQAKQQGQGGGQGEHRLGVLRFGIAHLGQVDNQLLALLKENIALRGDLLCCLVSGSL